MSLCICTTLEFYDPCSVIEEESQVYFSHLPFQCDACDVVYNKIQWNSVYFEIYVAGPQRSTM